MIASTNRAPGTVDFRALANFRYEIRRFLHASEVAARAESLEPRQHQILLAIVGRAPDVPATVAWLAERLQLRHHSVVGLLDRLEANGLARRVRDPDDRRRVLVTISGKGKRILHRLSMFHQQEIRSRAPQLIAALSAVVRGGARAR